MLNGKRFPVLLLVLLLFIPTKATAYNENGRVHFEALFEVLDRDITEENTRFAGEKFPETAASAQLLRLLGKLSVQVVDPLEIYGLLGGSDLNLSPEDFVSDFNNLSGGSTHV